MGRWWFVRHGESVANAEGWLAGHRDVELTPLGVQQARALAPSLERLRPSRVLTSDLQRAWRTAELAWPGRLPEPAQVQALRERSAGEWEGVPMRDLATRGAMEVMVSWAGSPPGGESQEALSLRVLDFLAEADQGEDTLVFAHGGLIRCVAGLLDGIDTDLIGRTKVANVEVVARTVPTGTWARLARGIRRLRGE